MATAFASMGCGVAHRAAVDTRQVFLGGAVRAVVGLGLFLLVHLLLAGAAAAQARKVVGIAFDNSGSMAGRTHLPVFGIQTLAASLSDGDALYALNFRDFLQRIEARGGRPVADFAELVAKLPVGRPAERQGTIAGLKAWAENPARGTPYQAVQVLLEHLSEVADPEDEVHAFVFTDGKFEPEPPPAAELEATFSAIRGRARARSFRVYFLAFADSQTAGDIRRQQVASVLDRVFNGGSGQPGDCRTANVFFMNDFKGLRSCLVDVVARIADTPREANPAIVRREGTKFVVDPPFTVSKLVGISTAPRRDRLPRMTQWPGGAPPSELEVGMARADEEARIRGGQGQAWQGSVWHMAPVPALAAGKPFEVVFDRPIDDQTDLLFRTNIRVEWSIFDPDTGQPVAPEGDTIQLASERDYELRAHVNDIEAGQNPKELPTGEREPTFTLSKLDEGGAPETRQMKISADRKYAAYPLRYDSAREDKVSVLLRLPGFVTAQGRRLKIKVVATNVALTFGPRVPLDCPGCTPDRIAPVLDGKGAKEAVSVALSVARSGSDAVKRTEGRVQLKLSKPLPPGVRLRVPSTGAELGGDVQSVEIPVGVGGTVDLRAIVDDGAMPLVGPGHLIELEAAATMPLIGKGSTSFRLEPRLPPLEIALVGVVDKVGSAGPTRPFELKPEEVAAGRALRFEVTGLHPSRLDGVTADQIRLDVPGFRVGRAVRQSADPSRGAAVFDAPLTSAALCDCFIMPGVGASTISVEDRPQPVQQTSFEARVLETSWPGRFFLCLALIIAVLVGLYLLAGISRFFQSNRFPRRSRLLIYPMNKPNDAEPKPISKHRLRYQMLPFLLPYRRWHQRELVGGLSLEACPGGALIVPPGERYAHLRLAGERKPLPETFSESGPDGVRLQWGDRLEELGGQPRRVYELRETAD